MHKKIVSVLFIIIVSALVIFFVATRYMRTSDAASTEAVLVTPQVNDFQGQIVVESKSSLDEEAMVSLIALRPDENLIGVVSQDFDGDGFEDQINAVKASSGPYISLVIGLYNSKTAEYERLGTIATQITQNRTFTFTGMDLTGDHRTALVYQGFTDNGDCVLQAYFISRKNGKLNLNQIVNLQGDGSVYIQQLDRYDAYERSNAKGTSYPIWVYNSDIANPNSTDQIQSRYEWKASRGKYELAETIRVAGSKIAAAELARIQDGTVETFSKFLEGLWYKPNGNGSMQYLFFDPSSSEVIFLMDETEEVYSWINSTIRRNGMYLSATNLDIENLHRRIDISLKSVDEIVIRIQDDLRMPISENNTWDGEYKKSGSAILSEYYQKKTEIKGENCLPVLEEKEQWKMSDGSIVRFNKGKYSVTGDNASSSGIYTTLSVSDRVFIQFRREAGNSVFDGVYMGTYAKSEDESKGDMVALQEYKIGPEGIIPAESRGISLTEVKQ